MLCSDAKSFQRMHQSGKNKLNLASHTFAEIKGEGEVLLITVAEQEKRQTGTVLKYVVYI